MTDIFLPGIPQDMRHPRTLPGVQPLEGTWLHCDVAYAGQMRRREELLETSRDAVVARIPGSGAMVSELREYVLVRLPSMGFLRSGNHVLCPDGREVNLGSDPCLVTLGKLVQCDFCLLNKVGAEHVLSAAILCFPASWTLSEKIGRALGAIHDPVEAYDADVARRVQRLFDGVQVGQPLWRFNQLWYDDPELFQPRAASASHRVDKGPGQDRYLRMERQVIFRLPVTGGVVFSIHTSLVRGSETSLP